MKLITLILIMLSLNFSILSQVVERQKPKIKDFGSSLKRKPEENLQNQNRTKTDDRNDDDVIRIDTNLVVLNCVVFDKKGKPVFGLKKEDFLVTEDNQPQEVQTFTLGDDAQMPRSIVLIIDYSSSQSPYIERSVEAAKLLVDKLRPNDLMALVTDDVKLIVEFTSDKNLLKGKLDSLKKDTQRNKFGLSKQYSSLYAVLTEMFDEEDVRPIILFQTDGDQVFGLKNGLHHMVEKELKRLGLFYSERDIAEFSISELAQKVEQSRATIYTIVPGFKRLGLSKEEREKVIKAETEFRRQAAEKRLGRKLPSQAPTPRPTPLPTPERIPSSPEERLRRLSNDQFTRELKTRGKIMSEIMNQYYPNGLPDFQEALFALSELSGGWLDYLEKPEDADGVYSRILSEIDTRYIIGYSPTNETKDGKRRTVKIEIKNHPEYTVWGRKSYFAKNSPE